MKKSIVWLLLLCKRLLKKPIFIIILLTLPILTLSLKYSVSTSDASLSVALYTDAAEGFSKDLVDELASKNSFVNFYICNSKAELYEQVNTKIAECGYIFYQTLEENLSKGNTKGQIDLVKTPNSIVSLLTNELVFASVFKQYSYMMLKEHVLNENIFNTLDQETVRTELKDLYEKNISGENNFSFTYDTMNTTTENVNTGSIDHYMMTPIRGIIAIFILISALSGAVLWYSDSKSGLFNTVNYRIRPFLHLIIILIPTILAGMMGIICINISGISVGIFNDFLLMFFYIILTSGFCNLLRILIKTPALYCSALPILTLGSIVCCPVFINLASIIPSLSFVQKIFIPTYFITGYSSRSDFVILIFLSLFLMITSLFLDRSGHQYAH